MPDIWMKQNEQPQEPLRSYCHPVDADMIKVLDNPVSRVTIGKLVEISADAFYGQMIASGVPITQENEPELNTILEECARLLCIPKPYMVLSAAAGFNAFTTGNDQKPYIVLGSTLVRLMTPEQLRFVIGHECGHIAMGHMIYHTAANVLATLAQRIPVVGTIADTAVGFALKAWNRRSEVSADRAGMLCCGSADVALRALLQLESQFVDASQLNTQAYVEDSRNYLQGSLLRRMGELTSNHPLTAKRMECIQLFEISALLFRICGREAPEWALSDQDLQSRVEKVLKVM